MKIMKTLNRAVTVATLSLGLVTGAMAEVVNIGFTGPLSGGAALYGENALSGLRMAIEEINTDGFDLNGKKSTINLVSLDDRYSPAQAATNAKRLKQQSNVPAVFVPHSGGVFALQNFNEKDNFLVMAYTTVPSVTEKGNTLTVRIPPTLHNYVGAFTEYAQKNFGKTIGLAGATHEYAKIWASMLEKEWTERGGTVVSNNPMDYNKSADFFTGVSRVIAGKPDVIFVGGASDPTGLVIQQARQMGFKGGFIIMEQAKIDEVIAAAGDINLLENSVGSTPLSLYKSEAAIDFIKRYEAKYSKTPGSEAAYHYLSMHALVEAISTTNSTEPKVLRAAIGDALKSLDYLKNPYEITSLTEEGGFYIPPTLSVVKDGKILQAENN